MKITDSTFNKLNFFGCDLFSEDKNTNTGFRPTQNQTDSSYASLYGDKNTKKFIANKIDTVWAVKRPPAQIQPEREKERTFQVHTLYLK